MFGDGDGFESALAGGDVNIAAHEIHEVGALQEELSHPGVVVVGGGDMAVACTAWSLCRARCAERRCCKAWPEKPSEETVCCCVVEPFAIGVLRADQHGAAGTRGRDAIAGDGAVDAEHVDVVAQDLEVVAGVIAGEQALVVEHGAAGVGGHLQMAAEAGGGPGSVAGVAGHAAVAVGEVGVVLGHGGIDVAVFGDELGAQGFFAEVNVAGSYGVGGLHDFPLVVLVGHGALNQRAGLPFEAAKSPGRAERIEMAAAFISRIAVDESGMYLAQPGRK